MRILLSISMSILFCLPLAAQKLSLSSPELYLQTRAFHQEDSYDDSYFRIQANLGVGVRWNLTFNPALSLSFGGAINYGNFEKIDRDNLSLYYVDYFQYQEFHYYNLRSISQWSAEIPVSLRWDFMKRGANTLGFFIGASPQIVRSSKAQGSGFEGDEERLVLFNKTDFPFTTSLSKNQFITDVFLQSGVYLRREILHGRSLFLETGYEYSSFNNSNGMILRLGYGF